MKAHILRLTFLFGAMLLHSTPYATLPATTTAQLLQAGAELTGSCPSGCKLVQNITNITTAAVSNGVRISFNWTLAQLPAGVKMVGFNVSAKLVLKNNQAVASNELNVGANATAATVVVSGIKLSDIKAGSAIVKAHATSTSNPTVNVTSKEIVGNDGTEVNMLVKWTAPSVGLPCLADRSVTISASAENAGGIKFSGVVGAKLTANSATVRLRGVGLRRKEMKNLQASIATGAVFLTCGLTKSIQAFGGAQGSNP